MDRAARGAPRYHSGVSVRKRVIVVNTGGTIGMKRGRHGYEPAPGYLAERLATLDELSAPELPAVELVERPPLLDSANMRPGDWERIAREIAERHEDADGFVVLHGTDTMAYTAAALSFLLEGLQKPVILTGSQIPLVEPRNDARENLVTSLLLATRAEIAEVAIYLSGVLLRGNRATKVSASGFDAFTSPNVPPLATVGVNVELDARLLRRPDPGPLRVRPLRDVSVIALRLFPGIAAATLESVLAGRVRGVVLETYGAGNAPDDPDLLAELDAAIRRGIVIVNCTQCLRGSVAMESYATGSRLAQAGVVGGGDMTVEAALAKLVYLLSHEDDPTAVRDAMARNLRGERTEPDDAARSSAAG